MLNTLPPPKPETPMIVCVLVAAFYGLMSASSILVNKYVLSVWRFDFPLTIVAIQTAVTLFLLVVLKQGGVISYPDWNIETAKKAWILAFSHVTNVLAGLYALNLVDVPMFGTLRRLVAACVMTMEYFVLGQRFSKTIIFAIGVMISGAIIGGWTDLRFDLQGYALTMLTNLITATTLVLIPKVGKEAGLASFGLMLYQSTLSLPVLSVAIFITGEYQQVLAYEELYNPNFQLAFVLASMQIFVLNYSIFWCTQINSPLTTTVTGQLKNVLQTAGGFLLFDLLLVPMNVFGICVGICGSFLYTYAKYTEFGGAKAVS